MFEAQGLVHALRVLIVLAGVSGVSAFSCTLPQRTPPTARLGGLQAHARRLRTPESRRRASRWPRRPELAMNLDAHIDVDTSFPGLRQIHNAPDIFLIDDLLSPEECEEIIQVLC